MADHLNPTDEALLTAALAQGPSVPLTPALSDGLGRTLGTWERWLKDTRPGLIAACPPETRLAVVSQVFEALMAHAKEDGTFRYLIYNRLGFGPEAYVPLYLSGGMVISNEFTLSPEGEAGLQEPVSKKSPTYHTDPIE